MADPLAASDRGAAFTPVNYVGGVAGGVAAGALGLFGGFFAGAAAAEGCQGEDCGLAQALLGGLIGEAVGVGVGAHFGSGAHGSGALSTAASVGVMGAAILGVAATRAVGGPLLIVVPGVQLAAVFATERATSSRAADR